MKPNRSLIPPSPSSPQRYALACDWSKVNDDQASPLAE